MDAIHTDDRDRVGKVFFEKAAIGTFGEEYRILTPDGTVRWIRDRCFPIRNDTDGVDPIGRIA